MFSALSVTETIVWNYSFCQHFHVIQFARVLGLIIYYRIPTFNDPEIEAFWKQCSEIRKCWWTAFSPFPTFFSPYQRKNPLFESHCKWSFAHAFSLDKAKIWPNDKICFHFIEQPLETLKWKDSKRAIQLPFSNHSIVTSDSKYELFPFVKDSDSVPACLLLLFIVFVFYESFFNIVEKNLSFPLLQLDF